VKTPHYYTTLLEIVNIEGWLNNNSHTYKEIKFSPIEIHTFLKKKLGSYGKKALYYNNRFAE